MKATIPGTHGIFLLTFFWTEEVIHTELTFVHSIRTFCDLFKFFPDLKSSFFKNQILGRSRKKHVFPPRFFPIKKNVLWIGDHEVAEWMIKLWQRQCCTRSDFNTPSPQKMDKIIGSFAEYNFLYLNKQYSAYCVRVVSICRKYLISSIACDMRTKEK